MGPKIYYYSKYQSWFMILGFGGIEIGILYGVLVLLADKLFYGAAMFSVLLILNAIGLIYSTRKYLIPAINNEVAIELDEKKIQYNIDNWELYWNEIENIDSVLYGMKFTMRNGDEIYLSCQYVGGDWDLIKDTIREYFGNNLSLFRHCFFVTIMQPEKIKLYQIVSLLTTLITIASCNKPEKGWKTIELGRSFERSGKF